jgi:hypothetical protein
MNYLLFRLKQKGFHVEQLSENELLIDWGKIYNEPEYLKEKSNISLQNIPIPKMIDNIVIPSSLQLPKNNTNINTNMNSNTNLNQYSESSKIHESTLHMPIKEPLFIIRRETKKDENQNNYQTNQTNYQHAFEKKDSIILGIKDSKPKQKLNFSSNHFEKQNSTFEKNKEMSQKKYNNFDYNQPEKNHKTKIILKTNKNKKEMNKHLPSFLS